MPWAAAGSARGWWRGRPGRAGSRARQAARSPLGATLILAPLVAGWHLPLAFLPGFQPIELLTTVAVTYWYTWLFDHARGSALITLIAHATEGTIQTGMFWSEGADGERMVWLYSAVWCAVALGLLVFDWNRWRARLPAAAAAAPVPIEARPGVSKTDATFGVGPRRPPGVGTSDIGSRTWYGGPPGLPGRRPGKRTNTNRKGL